MGIVKVTPQAEIDKYFASDALSQSMLKKLLGGIGPYIAAQSQENEKALYYEEKGSFVIGSAVDTILTGEEGEFEKKYHVSDITKKPSDTEMSIINWVFDDVMKLSVTKLILNLEDYPGSIEAAITEADWYGGKPGEKRIAGLIERGKDYFNDLKLGIGKQILSATEKKLIDDIVFSLRSNSRTAKYFNRKALEKDQIGMTVYYQLPIFFYYRNIYCKALLDILFVFTDANGDVKSVHPFDLKTMNGSTLKFISSLKSWRYDIQASWYVQALLSDNSTFELAGKITPEMIHNFKFIVESNNFPGQPLIYEVDENILNIGQVGHRELKVKPSKEDQEYVVIKAVKGFEDLLDIYEYQTENDWKEEEVIAKNDGVLKLGWNGIKE